MRNCVITFLCFVTSISFVGCAPPQETKLVNTIEASLDVTSDGISVIRIDIDPKVDTLEGIFTSFSKPIARQDVVSELKHEGILVHRIDAIDLPAIVASIGEVTDENFVWHGQIFRWRDVLQRVIAKQGMIITSEGIPYFIQGGYLSLLARSWVLQREDGMFSYLQIQPSWHLPRGQNSFISQGSKPLKSKVFTDLSIDLLLRNGEALLLATKLTTTESSTGPFDDGPPAVLLGEALVGGPVSKDVVVLLVIESNVQPRAND